MDKTIEDLWNEHYHAPFPSGCTGEEILGIDLVLLDTYTSGCIQTFITAGDPYPYRLDEPRIAMLGKCYRDLTMIQPRLPSEEARHYFSRLEKLAALILEWISAQHS